MPVNVQCRPMKVEDFGAVECKHWASPAEVEEYIERQGIASMLAYDAERCVGQLYLKEYDRGFRDVAGWYGERCWADFRIAEPLELQGRWLTLGCYHVGWMPDGRKLRSLRGKGIGTALLKAAIRWFEAQDAIDGLLSWALVPGSHAMLEKAGQIPYTVYRRFGFREAQQVSDPRWDELVRDLFRLDPNALEEDPRRLRVMILSRGR